MRLTVVLLVIAWSGAWMVGCGRGGPETDVAATENEHATPEQSASPQQHASPEQHAATDVRGTTAPERAVATTAEHAVAAPVAPGDRRLDARGIVVTRHADGMITVEGIDRWGSHVDVTYADGHYFKHAIDTLARSVSDEQAAALRETVPELAPEALNDTAPPAVAGSQPSQR